MFESSLVRALYHLCTGISLFFASIWMFIIVKHSPTEMSDFKWILLKLALMEELFSISLSCFLFADFLFPAEGVAVLGLAANFGQTGGRVAVAISFFLGLMVFVAINDCVIFRTLLFHQKDTLVRKLVSPYIGIPITVALHGFGCGIPLFIAMYLAFEDPTQFVARMKSLGRYSYVEYYATKNDTVFVSMDVKSIYTQIFIFIVLLGLLGIYAIHFGAAFILFRRLSSLQSHLSVASYKVHLTVLYLLISQNLYPIFVIFCPILYTAIGFAVGSNEMLGSDIWKHMAVSGLILYPFVGSVVSISIMKPYRHFMREKIFGLPSTSLRIVDFSSTSGNRIGSFFEQPRSAI